MEENIENVKVLKENILTALNCTLEEFGEAYRAYKTAELEFEKLFVPVKDAIIKSHETNKDLPNTLILGGIELTYVAPSTRTAIDSKKLKEEEPELVKKFTKITSVGASVRTKDVQVVDLESK